MIDIQVLLPPPDPTKLIESDISGGSIAGNLRTQMEAARTTAALVQGRPGGPSTDPLGINPILRLASFVPGIHAVGHADPARTSPATLRRVEETIEQGRVKALAVWMDASGSGFDAPGYLPYLELAAKHFLPVFLQPGLAATRSRTAQAVPIDDLADRHPDVPFILARVGPLGITSVAEVVARSANVWADLSGLIMDETVFTSHFEARTHNIHIDDLILDARKAFRRAGKPGRFLFGSAWPLASMAGYRTLIERIIPAEHHPAIFDANARSLFRLG